MNDFSHAINTNIKRFRNLLETAPFLGESILRDRGRRALQLKLHPWRICWLFTLQG